MGLLTVKKPGAVAPAQPDRNGNSDGFEIRPRAGASVKCAAVSEDRLRQIMREEFAAMQEAQTGKGLIQYFFAKLRRFFT